MAVLGARVPRTLILLSTLLVAFLLFADAEVPLPVFGRDTVLVWKIQSPNYEASFIARIASFVPDRFLEWEDGRNQGMLFISQRDILEAKGYENSSLFSSGMEKKSNNTTALWLSKKIFLELKEKKKAKFYLDGVLTKTTYIGLDRVSVELNRSKVELPVIKFSDERGVEWSFLDRQDNPLMLRQSVPNYSQTLISITTDRSNTLRWIKGKKLINLTN
jgi:hypothetical protein